MKASVIIARNSSLIEAACLLKNKGLEVEVIGFEKDLVNIALSLGVPKGITINANTSYTFALAQALRPHIQSDIVVLDNTSSTYGDLACVLAGMLQFTYLPNHDLEKIIPKAVITFSNRLPLTHPSIHEILQRQQPDMLNKDLDNSIKPLSSTPRPQIICHDGDTLINKLIQDGLF